MHHTGQRFIDGASARSLECKINVFADETCSVMNVFVFAPLQHSRIP